MGSPSLPETPFDTLCNVLEPIRTTSVSSYHFEFETRLSNLFYSLSICQANPQLIAIATVISLVIYVKLFHQIPVRSNKLPQMLILLTTLTSQD